MFLGYGIDIWITSIIVALFRLKQSKQSVLAFGGFVTLFVSIMSAVLLHTPLMIILSLSLHYKYFIIILLALTAENLMNSVIRISSDNTFIKNILINILKIRYDINTEKDTTNE